MGGIILHNQFHPETTLISNYFIDFYMPAANGAFVKVYLYLLRHLSCNSELTVSKIAEELDETEKDINRALIYWEKQKLLHITKDSEGMITDISILSFLNDVQAAAAIETPKSSEPVNDFINNTNIDTYTDTNIGSDTDIDSDTDNHSNSFKPNYTKAQIAVLSEMEEIKWIMGTLEQYLERLLKPADIQLILYLYEGLGFSAELILYLYEYCISLDKKSTHYIEAVALSWSKAGVDTVEKAEESSFIYNKGFQTVCKAFGIDRKPGNIEKQYIIKWFQTYCFDNSIVEEALSRTLLAAGKPDFKYADKILTNWHKKSVKQLSDIKELDKDYQKTVYSPQNKKQVSTASSNNKFNAFPQRQHTAEYYDSLEKHLLNKN